LTSPLQLTQQHRRNLQRLTAVAGRQTRSIVTRVDTTAVAEWWVAGADRQVTAVVAAGHEAAVQLTVTYLLNHARASGAEVDPLPAQLDLEAVRGSLFVVGPGAYLTAFRRTGSVAAAKRVLITGLVGNVQRLVLAGDRETVLATFRAGR
jgi:hypothetical protein